jgi:hypothetical protein
MTFDFSKLYVSLCHSSRRRPLWFSKCFCVEASGWWRAAVIVGVSHVHEFTAVRYRGF